jgi:hypothetical protein
MDKLLEALKKAKIEVTDDLKKNLQTVWDEAINKAKEEGKKDNGDLFTQEQLNEIISKRLSRQEKIHEAEIKELQDKMKGLLDPSKVKEFEDKIKELETTSKENQAKLKKEYELKMAAIKGGIKDPEYFEFLAQKDKLYDRIKVEEDGSLVVLDDKGNVLAEKDGKKFGPEKLIDELKENKPDLFGESAQPKPPWTPGATNPAGGGSGGDKDGPGALLGKQQKEAAQSATKAQSAYFGG